MRDPKPYHHGDLRAALVRAGLEAVEQGGPEAVSLREIAASLGVSRAAPYRHFTDRRALLAAIAAEGFEDLTAAYGQALGSAVEPVNGLRRVARAYLTLAFTRPGLYRLMFDSDILGADAPEALTAQSAAVFQALARAVADADPAADARALKLRAVTGWAALHGFISLVQARRLKGSMVEPLTEAEMVEAVIDQALAAR